MKYLGTQLQLQFVQTSHELSEQESVASFLFDDKQAQRAARIELDPKSGEATEERSAVTHRNR